MTMAAMLFSFAAMAQGLGTLSCEDVIYAGDPEEPAYLEVQLTTDDVTAISGIQFNFSLPEGVSIADDGEDYEFPIAAKKHNTGIMDVEGGYMVCLGGDNSLNYKDPTKNAVVTIGLVAAKGSDGEYTIKEFRLDASGTCAWLVPHNPDFQPIQVTAESNFQVWGVITFAIHKTRS